MSNFDLQIKNYTISELQEIFGLSDNYQLRELEEKGQKLVQNIQSDPEITQDVRQKTLDFLSQAKDKLISESMPNLSVVDIKAQPQRVAENIYESEHPSNYFPPMMNPVKKEKREVMVTVDSRYRENYYVTQSSNFHVTLPIKLSGVDSMKLAAIEFPPTAFFAVSKLLGNNFFWVRAGNSSAGDLEEIAIVLQDGNYTPTEATSLINSILQAETGSTYLQYIICSVNANASQTSGSGQLLVAVSESYPFEVPFEFTIDLQADINGNDDDSTPLPIKLGWKLGFRNGKYTGNSSYLTEGVVNLSGAAYLFLSVNDYNNYSNTFFSAFNESVLNKDILARLAVASSSRNAITYSNIGRITTPRQYHGPVDIEKMQIQLLDEFGRIVNLNNMDFSICLSFTMTDKFPSGKNVPTWPSDVGGKK
jgi:hypothetical protein